MSRWPANSVARRRRRAPRAAPTSGVATPVATSLVAGITVVIRAGAPPVRAAGVPGIVVRRGRSSASRGCFVLPEPGAGEQVADLLGELPAEFPIGPSVAMGLWHNVLLFVSGLIRREGVVDDVRR